MANVRVAVRVRPLSKREIANGGRIIIEIDDKVARIKNLKVDSRPDGPGGSREKVVAFGFDYCYWSVNPEDPQYASQDVVFQDLGTEVLSGAAKGYNICLFAYGQTGSGKTYTMIGTPAALGLTPRICEGLFSKEDGYSNSPSSCRIRVSFLEIYNEKVRDLLKQPDQKKPYTLRVREHPETGPYVQGLSQHVVTNSRQIIGLLEEGVANRITAATHVHEASSRSHAIFTIYYTQAVLENNLSSEIASKINLVDLAGSERADPSYCKDRITEGASINKSLVTLGIVISTLAQNSQMFISYQSPNSTSSEGGDGGSLSSPSVAGSIGGVPRKQSYIPYRDSVLTWLLKDSLGGNSKTIMVATVSPANSCYSETMSTLRYASSAKNIINKPRVNEDANVKLIRELREEIERLKGMLLSFELGNLSPFTDGRNGNLKELVLHNEMKKDQLPKDWTQKWDTWKALMEQCNVDINKKKAGVTIDSSLPHLMVLDDDVLSTGVVLYHLREGTTKIGRIDSDQEQDIVLQGQWIERDHCTITSVCGVVTLQPALGACCIVNGQQVTDSCRLTQGAIIILGQTQKFRFIHPAEAAVLRQRRLLGEVSAGNSNCSLGWLDLDGDVAASRLGIPSMLEEDRRVRDIVLETRHQKQLDQAVSHRTQIRLQKRLVEDLKHDVLVGQIRAEQELKFDQALINQQIKDNQRWLFREESLLASLQQQKQEDNVLAETDSEILHGLESQTGSETSSASLYGGRKRLAQLQVLWRNALWAAERKVRRKKVKFQLERIVKKQKLLEAQRKLEQLENLCWKDKLSQPMELDPSLDAAFSAFQKKSRSSSSSSLGNQRLCGLSLSPSQSVLKCEIPARLSTETVHYTPEKPASSVPRGSTILSNDSCSPNLCWVCEGRRASFGEDTSAQRTSPTISLKIASTADRKSQETGKNKQLVRLHQNLVSVSRSAEQLKLREKPNSLIPSPQIGREKPSRSHGPPRRKWRREGDLLTNWTSRRNGSSSPHSQGTKRSVVRGKVQMARLRQAAWALEQWEPSVASLARTSAWPRCHVFGVKDRDKRFLQNRGKTECDEGTWNSTVLRASTSSLGENENDCSDTDSTYSLDSLCCAYTRTLIRPQKQEVPEPKPCCTEPENSESDDSQMSQDSLVEKKNRAQRRLLPCSPLAQAPERSETRPVTSPKAFLPTPDSNPSWKKVRTFSLDSLNNAEEAFREDSKEEPCSHSSDEMPVEAFWQMKNSPSTTACQEKVLEFQASDQGPGATGPNVTSQPSGSFYLALQPKTEGDKCKPLPQTQHPRNISLASMDSWFSCDSGSNPNDSQEVTMYSQKMLDIQEPEVQHTEQPKPVVEAEQLQQPALEIGTGLHSFSHLQDSALVPSSATKLSIELSLDASSEATWRPQGPCKPGSDTSVSQESFHEEGRGLPSLAGYCSPVPSESALTSSKSAAPASLLSHKGSTLGKGRPVVEYLCQFSHSSLGATVTSTQVSSSSQKDTNYLPSTSGKRWDSFFPVCPEMPGDFDFNDPSFSSPSPRYLKTEQEQDGGNLELDDLSTFFRTIEKDACHSCSSTDLEARDSELENAWVFAAENKVSASMTELHQAHQDSSKQPQSLVCRRAGSAGSFDESFFLRDISNSSSPMNAKEDQGPPTWEENLPSKLVPLKLSQPVMKTELLQSANEEIDRERSFALALSTDSEPSPPWDPFPPPEQFHPLETFYVLESRDALTETALEIPACRERGEDMPPTSRVEGLNNTFQFFRNLDRDLLLLLHTPKSKNLSSQPVVAESSFSPGVRKDPSGTGVPKSMEKYNYPVSFSSAQNRLLLESISMAAGQLGKPAEILNNKYPQSSLKRKEKAPAQPSWGVPFDDSGAMVCLPVISSVERNHEHRQCENDVRGKQAGNFLRISATDFDGQIHSGPSSNLIYQTESLNQTQHRVNVQENVLVPKKHSSASHSRCMSPMIMVQDETSSHAKEGTESVSLGMVLHPKAYSEELIPHRADHSHGKDSVSNLLPAIAFKEEGPIASKEPESLMVIPSPQGEISRRRRNQISSQSKIVNHSEEMARLISSVAQLESSIMEIDSRQKYPPHALYMAEAYRRAMCRARKDQGKAHLTLRPNDFRDSLAYRDQPHSSKKVQEEEEVPDSFETRGIKEVNGCIQESHRAQEITSNLTSPTELMEENKMEAEHPFSPVPELSVRCPRDYLFLKFSQRCTTQNKPTNVPGSPEPLARIEPLRPEEERSEGSCDEQSASELSPQSHATVRTGVFPELEPTASFQESQNVAHLTITEITAKYKEPAVHGIDQETNTLRGKSPQTETHSAPLAQELPGISQITRMGRYRLQETEHPLPSPEGYPVASIQEETGSIFSSDPPKLSEKYFRSTMKAVSLSSTDSESELEFLKMQVPTPSEGRVEQPKIYGETGNHSSLGSSISCKNSFVEQSVWQSFSLQTVSGLCYQPNGAGSSPDEPSSDSYTEKTMKASATAVLLEQQRGDPRITPKEMNLGNASLTEAKVTLLRNIKRASSLNQCLVEKRASHQWADSELQVPQTLEKKLWRTEDFEGKLTSSLGFWGASAPPSVNVEVNIETTVEDTGLSEECGKSSKDNTDEQIVVPKLSRASSGLWEASAISSMNPKMIVETTVGDIRLSEEHGKSSKDSTDEKIIMPELTRVLSGLWGSPSAPSMNPKMNVDITAEDTKVSEEHRKSSEGSTDKQIIMPKLTRVSSGLWGASTTPCMYPEGNVEPTVEDTRLSEEREKSSKDSTDEHVVIPKLTRVSSRLWGASATPPMYPKTNVETTVEDTELSEEYEKSSEDNTDEHVIIPKLTRVSSGLWEASANPSIHPEADVETTVEDTELSEECEKSSKDGTDEHVVIPKLTRVSSGLWEASATPSMYPKTNVETIVEDAGLSEEHGKSSKDRTDEHITIPELTRVSSELWEASATPSMYPEADVETTLEDTKLSEEYEKSSKDNMNEHVVIPKLTRVSSELWGASATPSIYSEADVETIVEDTGLSEEYEKSSKDNMDEHVVIPKLTRVSSGLWGASATPSMYSEADVETIVEDTGLSEEYEKSSKDNMDEHVVIPKLTRVSSRLWGASATPSMYPKTNVETIVEDTELSEEYEKSSEDNMDEHVIMPKLARVSSELWGASATPSMYSEADVETIVEDTGLSEECEKSSKDIIGGQIIVPYSETQLDSEAFSGTPEQPHSNQRDRLELARTEDKDESQVCFMQNKATKGHIREASPGTTSGTKLYVADGLQLTKDVTVPSRGPEHASSLSLSTKINPGICISSSMQTAGEKLTRHLDPHVLSESPDRKEEVIRSPSVDSLLTSRNLLVPSALKENKRDEPPQQQLSAPPLHANSDNIRIIRHELSHAWPSKQIGIHSEVERTSLGSKESIQRAWEGFRSQSTACESLCTGDLGNSSEAVVDLQTHWETSMQCPWKDAPVYAGSEISATEMSYVMANSATLWPDLRSQESFHNRKQPVSCEAEIVEAEKPPYFANPLVASDIKQSGNLPAHPTCVHSPGSGERRASHKQDMMVCERVEGGSTGGTLSQYPKLKGVTVSGQSVAYGIDSKHPRPTSFLHQSLTPAFVGEMENCPEGSMVQRNRETSKSSIKFSPSVSQEEVVTSRPLCTSQQGAACISSPPFANSLSYENSDSEKQIPQSASDTALPVFPLSSKLNVGHQSRGLEVPLTHNLDLREDEQELRLAASNTGFPSMESPGREDSKKEVTIEPEMASSPAKTYSENLQENSKVGQNEWEFSPVTESGNYVAAGKLEAIHRSEGILENEPTVESPHLAQGPPFPKDLRDHSIPIPHPRTKAGKKPIFSNLPGSLWKKDENEQLSSNVGNEVWDRKHHHSGTDDQASPQETGGSLTMDGKVSGPERLRFLWERKDGSFDAQVPAPLPEVSQDSPDTGSHSDQNAANRVAFSFSPENSPKDFSALKSSVGTPCRSLQELTMSVEPPSPTEDEESRGTERLFPSDLSPDESKMMMLTELKKFPRSLDGSQRILSNYSSEAPSAQPPELGISPYPTSSPLLAMPVPEGRSSGSLVEEHNGHPKGKGWLAPEDKDVMHFMSSHRHPFLQCRQQEGPGRIGWKQHVFDSARDISCNQISWSLDTQRAVCCSSVDNDLDTLSSPFHSHLSSYANTHGVSLSSTEDPAVLEEERKRCKISHVFRNHHGFSDTSITAPSTRTPDKAGDGLPEDSTLTEQEGVSGQMDNIELLYPTKSESWPKAGVATCEQGTASLASPKLQQVPMHCQGCVDVTHPNPEATRSRPPRASWTNMQNLSMHLSQLLHNTSELLGNLSHQGKGERERSIKAEALEEAPKAVTMDNSTQTTMDVGIQTDETDPAPPDVFLHSSGRSKLAGPQKANVTTPKHGSLGGMDTPDIPQEDYPPVFQEKGPGGPAEKKQISSSPGNQRHYLIPRNSPGTSHHSLSFQKHSPAQDLLNLQTSSAISPTQSSQRNGSSCTVVTSPTLCTMSSARGSSLQGRWSTCESASQKNKKPGFRHTLLVDRASSPILTLSASIQGPHSSSSSSKPTGPAVSHSHSTIHHQKPGATWVAPGNNSLQTCDKGKTRNIPGGSGSSTGKKLSKGSPTSHLSGTLKQSLWLQGSSASTSPGPLNHPPKLQVRASLGLLNWEEQLTGGKEKHGSWERPLYVSLPTTGVSPIEDQSEASNTSNFVAQVTLEAPNPVLVRLASQSTSWCQKKIDTGADSSEQPLKSPPQSESPSLGRVLNHCDGPLSISEVSVAPGVGGQVRDTQSEVLLRSCPEKVQASEPRHYSLRDLPVHNKFSNWCGVQGSSPTGTIPVEEAMNVDITCSEGMEKPAQPHEHLSPVPEQLQREQVQVLAGVPLELGPQTPPLSVELAEAKLLYGLGETDALLRVMQSGTGEALIPVTPTSLHQEETYFRHLKTIEVIRRERSDRLQNFRRRARSLSPMKQLSLLPTPEALVQDPDLPSRRREYLQQLRKDVVETTRQGPAQSSTWRVGNGGRMGVRVL